MAVPLTAAAVGGLVGAAMWFTRPTERRRLALVLFASSLVVVLVLYGALGLMEFTPLLQGLHFGLHLFIAVVALLALRIGLQTRLLYETHDQTNRWRTCPVPALRTRRAGYGLLPELWDCRASGVADVAHQAALAHWDGCGPTGIRAARRII